MIAVCSHLARAMDEEGSKRWELCTEMIGSGFSQSCGSIHNHWHTHRYYSKPMFTIYLWTHQSDSLYNIVDGQVVSKTEVNVQDAVEIEQDTRISFASSLPGGFHHPIKKTVETMHVLKRGAKIKGKTVYGLDAVFVPPSLIDQYGCIRKRSKAVRKGLGMHSLSGSDTVSYPNGTSTHLILS